MKSVKSLQDILERAALTERGITFINGRDEDRFLSYRGLYERALGLLERLRACSFEEGAQVIFQVKDNEYFVALFWACLLGGMIPVPLTTGDSDENRLKLFKVWETLNSPFLVTEESNYKRQEGFFRDELKGSSGRVIFVEELLSGAELCRSGRLEGGLKGGSLDDIAFIQFSSGSTGNPKGVTLTHKNLLTNLDGIVETAEMDESDAFLSWMPLTHDMGMIGFHLVPLFLGINQYLMPSTLFIRRPFIWIDRVNRYRATILSSPNFGYKYFLKFFAKMDSSKWDLSCIRLIFNGAEPISSRLCQSFLDTLEPFGLKREAMFTVYGLAEASLAVAFPPLRKCYKSTFINRRKIVSGEPVSYCDENHKDAMEFVIEGSAVKGCRLRIVDERGNPLADNTIGYIEIGGDNVTSGYYNNEEASRGCISPEGWLNTGDLGFMSEGSLVVTGRAKDIIFLNGANYYSHDLERVIEEGFAELAGAVVIFASFDTGSGVDRIRAAVIYRKSDYEDFINLDRGIKGLIYERLGLRVEEVIPISSIPKTTSGKVQRYKIKESYENGDYDEPLSRIKALIEKSEVEEGALPVHKELEERFLPLLCRVTGCESLTALTPFFELGLDSLGALELVGELARTGIKLRVEDVYNYSNLRELAAFIEKGRDDEELGLSPLQQSWLKQEEREGEAALFIGFSAESDLAKAEQKVRGALPGRSNLTVSRRLGRERAELKVALDPIYASYDNWNSVLKLMGGDRSAPISAKGENRVLPAGYISLRERIRGLGGVGSRELTARELLFGAFAAVIAAGEEQIWLEDIYGDYLSERRALGEGINRQRGLYSFSGRRLRRLETLELAREIKSSLRRSAGRECPSGGDAYRGASFYYAGRLERAIEGEIPFSPLHLPLLKPALNCSLGAAGDDLLVEWSYREGSYSEGQVCELMESFKLKVEEFCSLAGREESPLIGAEDFTYSYLAPEDSRKVFELLAGGRR